MSVYIGIDPGLSGAVAVHVPGAKAMHIFDVPTFTITRNGKLRRELDAVQFSNVVRSAMHVHGSLQPQRCVIEAVSAMPKQGIASAFTFGRVYGQMEMAFVAHGVVPARVPAAVWKRSFGLNSDKDASRRLASALLPEHAHNWPLAKHDGRAEAALLALYAAKLEAAEMMA